MIKMKEETRLTTIRRGMCALLSPIKTFLNSIAQFKEMKKDALAIKNIKNPSEEEQLAEIRKNIYTFEHIQNPTPLVQLEAVKINPDFFQHIKNPHEDVQLYIVEKDYNSIQYIKNPSEAVQLVAIRKNINAINFINNPSKTVCCEMFEYFFHPIKQPEPYFLDVFADFTRHTKENIFNHLNNKEEFFRRLPAYQTELKETKYFESLLNYFILFEKTWFDHCIKSLAPLTKEQGKIWKKYRLKAIV